MFDFIMSMSQAYGIFYGSMRNLFVSLIWLFLNIAGLLIGVEIISFIYEKNQYKYRMLFLNPSKLLLKIYFQQDIIRYKKDEIVFNHDNPSLFVYFVVDGQIETTINNNQRVISNNNYFGELSIINNTKRVGNARVVSDWAKVIKIPNALFKKLLRQDIEFQNLILKNLNKIIIN
jgi:membrane protein